MSTDFETYEIMGLPLELQQTNSPADTIEVIYSAERPVTAEKPSTVESVGLVGVLGAGVILLAWANHYMTRDRHK